MKELSKIAAVSGQGGLFLIHSPLKNGVVLERLDEKKTKLVAGATSRVSVLSEISVYTQTADGAVALSQVLENIATTFPTEIPVNPKSEAADLKKFLVKVLPDADLERVYPSDIKKLVSWYLILKKEKPQLWEKEIEKAPDKAEAKEPKVEKPKKPKAAKKKED